MTPDGVFSRRLGSGYSRPTSPTLRREGPGTHYPPPISVPFTRTGVRPFLQLSLTPWRYLKIGGSLGTKSSPFRGRGPRSRWECLTSTNGLSDVSFYTEKIVPTHKTETKDWQTSVLTRKPLPNQSQVLTNPPLGSFVGIPHNGDSCRTRVKATDGRPSVTSWESQLRDYPLLPPHK